MALGSGSNRIRVAGQVYSTETHRLSLLPPKFLPGQESRHGSLGLSPVDIENKDRCELNWALRQGKAILVARFLLASLQSDLFSPSEHEFTWVSRDPPDIETS